MTYDLTRFDLGHQRAWSRAYKRITTVAGGARTQSRKRRSAYAFCLTHPRKTKLPPDYRAVFLTPGMGREKVTMLINGTRSRVAVLAVAVLAVAACKKKENYGADTTAAASSTVTGDTSTNAMAPPPPSGTWTDPNIVALLDEANMADSSAGSIAATKGTASDVREFARRM